MVAAMMMRGGMQGPLGTLLKLEPVQPSRRACRPSPTDQADCLRWRPQIAQHLEASTYPSLRFRRVESNG